MLRGEWGGEWAPLLLRRTTTSLRKHSSHRGRYRSTASFRSAFATRLRFVESLLRTCLPPPKPLRLRLLPLPSCGCSLH